MKRHQASALAPVLPPHRLTGPRLGDVFARAAPKVVNHAERDEEEGEPAGEDEDHRALDAEKQGLIMRVDGRRRRRGRGRDHANRDRRRYVAAQVEIESRS